MKRHKNTKRRILSFLICLISSILLVFLLVLLSVLLDETPEPDRRAVSARAEAEAMPTVEPEPLIIDYPDPNAPVRNEALQQILDAFVAGHPGEWDIYVYNLTHGDIAVANTVNGQPMISASLIKLYIMGAVFEQIQEEKLQYWDVYGSVKYMIALSDNYSANYLIHRLGEGDPAKGFECVNAFAQSIGCEKTSIHRSLLETDTEEENYTSAEDCAILLRQLYRCILVSPEHSKTMIELLEGQTVNDRLPVGLPAGTACAHKTGDLTNLSCGDVGLIFSPQADYILAVINNHSTDDPATIAAIAELSGQVYTFFNPPVEETVPPEESAPLDEP